MIAAPATIELTPAMIARAIWSMDSEEQAEMLNALAAVIREDHKTNPSAYSLGERQWFYLGDRLLNDPELDDARQVLMSMAAPLFLNVLRVAAGGAS